MNRIMIACAALLGGFYLSTAQEKGDVELGLGIGDNSAEINLTTKAYYNPKIDFISGPNYAFSAEYYFSDRWGIKGKLIYDKKGWTYTEAYEDDALGPQLRSGEVRVNYITVPVMMNWHFGGNRGWYLNFGPYLGFLTSADDKVFEGGFKNEYRKIDGGLSFGAGYKFRINNTFKFFVEAEFQSGMPGVYKTAYNYNGNTFRGSFNIGCLISLKNSANK